jgi:hypothetical protein
MAVTLAVKEEGGEYDSAVGKHAMTQIYILYETTPT